MSTTHYKQYTGNYDYPYVQTVTSDIDKCNFRSHMVLMKGITWARDSHGLFDYESKHLTKRTMKTAQATQVVRKLNELEILPLGRPIPNDDENKQLLKIVNENNMFFLESYSQVSSSKVESRELNENMFLVVRSLKNNNQKIDYEIQQGDILKVGRVKFAVKEIHIMPVAGMDVNMDSGEAAERVLGLAANAPGKAEDEEQEDLEEFGYECVEEYEEVESILDSAKVTYPVDSEEVPRCRFCWDTIATPENPLFSTCKCSGSVGYIHFDCLRSWLDVKKQQKANPCFSSYFWKSFECEICKKAYPLVLRTKCALAKSGYRTYNLVDYQRPEGNFLVLESLNQEKNTSRIIHIISPSETKNAFKFGRGHESDLRINDISVSRCHAIIKYKEDGVGGMRFYLEDNMSKFGTLVLVRQKTPLIPGYNKAVQIGRTVINFSVKSNQGKLQDADNFGPRPQHGLIKGKIGEAEQIMQNAAAAVGAQKRVNEQEVAKDDEPVEDLNGSGGNLDDDDHEDEEMMDDDYNDQQQMVMLADQVNYCLTLSGPQQQLAAQGSVDDIPNELQQNHEGGDMYNM